MTIQERFETRFLPELHSRARARFSYLDAEASEEAVQELCAACWALFLSACQRGREQRLTAYALVLFGIRNYRAGRRMAGATSAKDVMAPRAQALGRSRLVSMDAPTSEGVLQESLQDRAGDPAELARLRIDWAAIASGLNLRQRRVLELLAQGFRPSEIARALEVSPGRVSQIKRELAEAIAEAGYAPAAA